MKSKSGLPSYEDGGAVELCRKTKNADTIIFHLPAGNLLNICAFKESLEQKNHLRQGRRESRPIIRVPFVPSFLFGLN